MREGTPRQCASIGDGTATHGEMTGPKELNKQSKSVRLAALTDAAVLFLSETQKANSTGKAFKSLA